MPKERHGGGESLKIVISVFLFDYAEALYEWWG